MKKVLVVLGGVFAALLVVAAVAIGFAAYFGSGLDQESKAYVEATVPPILSSWSIEKLKEASAPQLLEVLEREADKSTQLFEKLSTLGALQGFGDVQGQAIMSATTENGKSVTANYTANAQFENGPAAITIKLIQVNEQWRLTNLHVNSDIFLK